MRKTREKTREKIYCHIRKKPLSQILTVLISCPILGKSIPILNLQRRKTIKFSKHLYLIMIFYYSSIRFKGLMI